MRLKVCLCVVAVALALNAFAAAPNVSRILPAAAIPGQDTTITFLGDNLEGSVSLWTSFSCDHVPVRTSSGVTFALKLPADAGPGLGAVRLVTTNGLSGLTFILVDPFPTLPANATNHSAATAQPLTGPVAVDAAGEELRSDFYRISAKKAERVSIEVVAQRLGSPLDPLLRVTDSSGREIAGNDDAPGLGADARLDFVCPKTGDYFIEVRDTRYGGGSRHHYRLRLGTPLPNPLPFLASREFASLVSAPEVLPRIQETEPNDMASLAQRVEPPGEITGRFAAPGDRDVYEFPAQKSERILFTGQSRSLGSPGDLFLRLETTSGSKLATANASAGDEGVLTNRFNEAGIFRLVVEELNHLGGPGFTYQLAMRPLTPGFTLSTETDSISASAADSFEIEVQAARRDYDGPIQFHLDGLPKDFAAANACIPAKTNSAKIRIEVPDDLALGDFFPFSITGTAEIDSSKTSARVSTLPALRAAFPALRYLPQELDGLIALSIAESKSSKPAPPRKKRKK